jgi:hypothetical protein
LPTKSSKASTNSKPKSQAKSAAPASSRIEQARATAQSALDVPVGAVLEVSDRVVKLVKQATGEARKTGAELEQRVRKAADQLAALR